MGHVLHVLLAVAVLAAGEAGLGTAVVAPWAVGLLALGPHAGMGLAQRLAVRGRFRAAARVDRALTAYGWTAFAFAVLGLGWRESVVGWFDASTTLGGWPGPELAAALAPYFVYELASIDARARLGAREPAARRRLRAFQLRMFSVAFTPFAGYAFVTALIGSSEVVRVHVEEIALADAALTAVTIVGFAAVLPTLLRLAWDTRPLEPGPLRELLEAVAARARLRYRALLVWNTGGFVANAAVIGFGGFHRVVLFSDVLLRTLDPREIAAVMAHEVGHAKRHHTLLFGAWALAAFLVADLVTTWIEPEHVATPLVVYAAMLVVGGVAFSWLSRRVELDADLYAVDLLGDAEGLAGALRSVTGAHAHERSSWRHFSTARRIEFLAEVERDPRKGARLRRLLRAFAWAGALVLVAALAGEVHVLAGRLPVDRMYADLALGRFEAAAARSAELELEDDAAATMLLLALHLEGRDETEPLTLADVELRARETAHDAARSSAWLRIADHARSEDARTVLLALNAAREDGLDAARRLLDGAPTEWRTAFGRAIEDAARQADDAAAGDASSR